MAPKLIKNDNKIYDNCVWTIFSAIVAKSGGPMGSVRWFLEAPCLKMLSQGSILGPCKSTKSMHKSIHKSMPKTCRKMIARSSENEAKMIEKLVKKLLVRERVVLRKLYYFDYKTIFFEVLMFQ